MTNDIFTVTEAGTIEVVTGNYKYNGVTVPSPSKVKCAYHKQNRAFIDAFGNEKVQLICNKRAVTHQYINVSKETFDKLKEMLDLDGPTQHLILTTQFDGYKGTIDMYVRVGYPVETEPTYSSRDKRIVSFDLHFIEPFPYEK